MKTLLSFVLVASILVTTGALVCQKCVNYNGITCDNYTNETCSPLVRRCFVTIIQEKLGGKLTYFQSSRGCASVIGSCLNNFNMTMGTGKQIVSRSHCCRKDHCNKKPIKWPEIPEEKTGNGLYCPACIKEGNSCSPKEVIECQGHQNQCFTLFVVLSNRTESARWTLEGCTTRNVCDSCIQEYKKPLPLQDYTMSCSVPETRTTYP
ncbi:phospholipase A2 inhibitor and Ly6/PLAUR domain-containing protein-like [Mantella aurantiaca]